MAAEAGGECSRTEAEQSKETWLAIRKSLDSFNFQSYGKALASLTEENGYRLRFSNRTGEYSMEVEGASNSLVVIHLESGKKYYVCPFYDCQQQLGPESICKEHMSLFFTRPILPPVQLEDNPVPNVPPPSEADQKRFGRHAGSYFDEKVAGKMTWAEALKDLQINPCEGENEKGQVVYTAWVPEDQKTPKNLMIMDANVGDCRIMCSDFPKCDRLGIIPHNSQWMCREKWENTKGEQNRKMSAATRINVDPRSKKLIAINALAAKVVEGETPCPSDKHHWALILRKLNELETFTYRFADNSWTIGINDEGHLFHYFNDSGSGKHNVCQAPCCLARAASTCPAQKKTRFEDRKLAFLCEFHAKDTEAIAQLIDLAAERRKLNEA